MSERVVLAIGTKKGLFVAESSKSRRKFDLAARSAREWRCTPR
jgi:hypothetical protein